MLIKNEKQNGFFAASLLVALFLCCQTATAGVFSSEYDVSAYEVEIKDDVGPEMIPYRLSVPERNGNPLQRINFVIIHFRGVGDEFTPLMRMSAGISGCMKTMGPICM